MKMNHKIVMVSIAALMGLSPLMGINTTTSNNQVAYASVYKTTGSNKVKVIKSTSFVNGHGTKQAICAEKGGSYKVYAVNYINGVAYLSINKSNEYWLPISAVKGKVNYQRDNVTYSLTANDEPTTVAPHASDIKIGNITLKSNAYVYDANGKRVKNGLGKYYISKGATLPYYGFRTIAGKRYYSLGKGQYIKAGNVSGSSSASHSEAARNSSGATPTDYTKPNLTLKKDSYPYNSNGRRMGSYLGFTYIKKGTTINYYGTKKINGQLYYYIGDSAYIKSANVKSTSKGSTVSRSKNTITLGKKAYPYTASGKRMSNYIGYTYINKGAVLNYYGTKKINGKTYYYIGDNAYVNAANVNKVTNR